MSENMNEHGDAKRQVRIFMDGAFDLMHYGHMNAFRLGRSLGTYLVVGVNSDKSIAECKGPPLMNDQERLTMVKSCKFVDEVIPDCPYIMNAEYVHWVIQEYKIDFVVHGDDPCIVDGKDVYETAKEAGKFRTIPRTHGISTTDIIGRMLQFTKQQQTPAMPNGESIVANIESAQMQESTNKTETASSTPFRFLGQQSKFLVTSRLLHSFYGSHSSAASLSNRKTVYIDGAWDLFHPGHVAILQAAKERGDFLVVGVHGDSVVNRMEGINLPIMSLHERVLGVLGCRYVDDVLIDAPYAVTSDVITVLGVDEILCVHSSSGKLCSPYMDNGVSRFQVAIELGILKELYVDDTFHIEYVLERMLANATAIQTKFERKAKVEEAYMGSLRKST